MTILALQNLLNSIATIPDNEWDWLKLHLQTKQFNVNEELFTINGNDRSLHFIQQGLVRYSYLTADGMERNHNFAAESNLVACFRSFINAGKCTYNITALENTATLTIPGHFIDELLCTGHF